MKRLASVSQRLKVLRMQLRFVILFKLRIRNKCYQIETFSTCFLRFNGFWGLDCSQIAPNACVPSQDPDLITKPGVFYVAYNIYGKH